MAKKQSETQRNTDIEQSKVQKDGQPAKEWPVSKHKCWEILNELLLSNQKHKYVLNQTKGFLSNQQRKSMPNQPKEAQWTFNDAGKYKLGLLEQSKVQKDEQPPKERPVSKQKC